MPKMLKKMFAEKSAKSTLKEVVSHTYPNLYTGKEWYVGFYAFDPVRGGMRRKKIKINFIEKVSERRKYAEALRKRIIQKLDQPYLQS